MAEGPSIAEVLVAGQQGEVLEPFFGPCCAANVSGKGRGLRATADCAAGRLLLLEPMLASGLHYPDAAEELCWLAERDDVLLGQLMSLAVSGDPPTAVSPMKEGEEESFLVRDRTQVQGEACLDGPNFTAAKKFLLKDEDDPDDPHVFRDRLKERLERILHANGFRGSSDPFGPLVWRTLTSCEQTTIWDQDPSKVPAPRIFLFLRACLLNHSENPNAAWYVVSNAIVVHAIDTIAQGDEVTISYWPDIDAADAHEVGLFEAYGLDSSTVGTAPELVLTPDQREHLQGLKRLPFEVAQRLMNRSVSPNKVDP